MAKEIRRECCRPRLRLKCIDDVFHRVIIALERLETFLEFCRKGKDAAKFIITGMNGPRDLHDDLQCPPTRESLLGEIQLQCAALFFQVEFDDEGMFKHVMNYFMSDLLEWYGGRSKSIPYDEVEKCVLPILVALNRQADSVSEIMQVYREYVSNSILTNDIDINLKNEHVSGFVLGGFIRPQEFVESEAGAKFSEHRRGSANNGYRRLMAAMLKLYDTTAPAKRVRDTFTAYVKGLPEFTDEVIDQAIARRNLGQPSE